MKLVMYLGIIFLRLVYFFIKLIPVQNKIVFISRQTNNPSLDFLMLEEELKNICDSKIVFVTRRIRRKPKDIIKNADILFKEMYHLATSKVCIADGYNIPISVLKHKKKLKVIQIWHALGAIKKFGYQSLNTNEKKDVSKIMKMHKNYDYIITGSTSMIKYFSLAFNYDKNKFFSIGLPRIDYIKNSYDENRQLIYSKYPEFREKEVILYVPTFRENKNYKINELIKAIDLNKYILIIKLHPNMNRNIVKNDYIYMCNDFTSLQLLSIANYVITDYSAISIEASILDIPIYLYCYDYKKYSKYPGLNINLKKELPGCVFENAKELYKSLSTKKYDINIVKKYREKYVCNINGDVTKNLANFIVERGINDESKSIDN